MLTIRDAQRAMLLRRQDRVYVNRLASCLRRDQPSLCDELDDGQLVEQLLLCVDKARRYGFSESLDVMAYFSATRRFSPGFDEAPSAFALLADTQRPAWQRLHEILQLPVEQVQVELCSLSALADGGERPC